MVRDLGLEREVIFTGYRDGDLPAVLQALDTFVLMGAGSDESCRAALEAMAAGRPVVARRVGALPDAVAHGETGTARSTRSGRRRWSARWPRWRRIPRAHGAWARRGGGGRSAELQPGAPRRAGGGDLPRVLARRRTRA